MTETLETRREPPRGARAALAALVAFASDAAARVLPPPGTRARVRLQRLRSRWWFFATVGAVAGIYLFYVSAGGLRYWPVWGVYLDMQADGFLSGHLYVPLAPDPELLAAENPYDRKHQSHWALDLSYYRGRYYTYWGPVPALIQAAVKGVLGIRHRLGDQYLMFGFSCLALVAGALIVDRMARRLFGSVPRYWVVLGVLVVAFANPTLHALTTGGTYQTAIVAGQAWVLVGLVFAFDAVWNAGKRDGQRRRLLFAGVALTLGLASRVTLAPAIALFALLTVAIEAWSAERRFKRMVANSLWLGSPLVAGGLALLAYNKIRFDSWTEFGTNIQVSGLPTLYFGSRFYLPNLYSYALRPFEISCEFPYFFQVWSMGSAAFPEGYVPPRDYMVAEPVVGWLRAAPITWFIPVALVLVPRPLGLGGRRGRTYLWCLGCFGALASVSGLVAMGVYGATMRYLNDVTYGLVFVGLLGAFALRAHRVGHYAARPAGALFSGLCLLTILFGLALGYQGYGGQFRAHRPNLDARLTSALSVCGNVPPKEPNFLPR